MPDYIEGIRVSKPRARKWVKALRSGKYKQAKGFLRNTDGYCCLGVLADITDPHGWEDSAADAYRWKYYLCQLDVITKGNVIDATDLADRNDGTGNYAERQDFNAIADHIEQAFGLKK